MSVEDAAIARASKKLFTRSIRCTECGSIVYTYRDDAGSPRLIERTDRRTVKTCDVKTQPEEAPLDCLTES